MAAVVVGMTPGAVRASSSDAEVATATGLSIGAGLGTLGTAITAEVRGGYTPESFQYVAIRAEAVDGMTVADGGMQFVGGKAELVGQTGLLADRVRLYFAVGGQGFLPVASTSASEPSWGISAVGGVEVMLCSGGALSAFLEAGYEHNFAGSVASGPVITAGIAISPGGTCQGKPGEPGKPGKNGNDAAPCKDGKDGRDGTNGTNGKDGVCPKPEEPVHAPTMVRGQCAQKSEKFACPNAAGHGSDWFKSAESIVIGYCGRPIADEHMSVDYIQKLRMKMATPEFIDKAGPGDADALAACMNIVCRERVDSMCNLGYRMRGLDLLGPNPYGPVPADRDAKPNSTR